jgi:hypothetical protein
MTTTFVYESMIWQTHRALNEHYDLATVDEEVVSHRILGFGIFGRCMAQHRHLKSSLFRRVVQASIVKTS